MNSLKAVIFDVDGVIIDSRHANAEFYALLLERAGYPRPSRAEIDACFHLTMWHTIEQLTGLREHTEIDRIWNLGHERSLYPAHLLEFPDSLTSVLAELHSKYRLAIVTGRVKDAIDMVYESADVKKFFEVAVSFDDYRQPKPHPEPLLVALRKLALEPHQAVYIGDSNTDIEAAQVAGMPSIHLAPHKHDNATVGITSFDQIVVAVAKIAEGIAKPLRSEPDLLV